MGAISNIAWTDATFNGWIGCTEAGPGCDGCYARELDARYQWGVKKDDRRTDGKAPHWGVGAPRYRTSTGNWRGPHLWNNQAAALRVPRKVFAHSLSDVFDNEVPEQWRADLFSVMKSTPWLRWQVLTKRVPNIRKMLPLDWGKGYPNVGLVATCVTQKEFDRDAGSLLDIPARWHGFSLEPQIERIELIGLLQRFIRSAPPIWIITGGESAQKGCEVRPYDIEWARSLIKQASVMPSVKVFVKQIGSNPYSDGRPMHGGGPTDDPGSNPDRWPADIRVRDFVPELLS